MKQILVTGSAGFIGKHLVLALREMPDVHVLEFDVQSELGALDSGLSEVEVVFHLAGVNRPRHASEYHAGNVELTERICTVLARLKRAPTVVLSSSIQATLDNPYGVSKRAAEDAVTRWTEQTRARAVIFRLQNVFGKWCRPNYNSVTATFCYNVAHGLPLTISDPDRHLELVYVDDVVSAFIGCLDLQSESGCERRTITKTYRITLGELAARIRSFAESRRTLILPSFEDEFNRRLYATYLSYLEGKDFAYRLDQKCDARGGLAEFIKSTASGQIFVSRTKPGVTRGNHYHNTKTEKFLVVEGTAMIRFRPVLGGELIEHRVDGREFTVVDIPPGYAHSIENIGTGDLVTLFWASEIFSPANPDVCGLQVTP